MNTSARLKYLIIKIINVKICFISCLFLTLHSCTTQNDITSESAILESHTKINKVTYHDCRPFSVGNLNSKTRKYVDNLVSNVMMQAFYWDVHSDGIL